nr:hypothetical protein HK105_008020 [Polyrhizophydium stewartii]
MASAAQMIMRRADKRPPSHPSSTRASFYSAAGAAAGGIPLPASGGLSPQTSVLALHLAQSAAIGAPAAGSRPRSGSSPVTTAAQAGTASGGMAAASAGADQHTGESDAALAARLLRRFSAFPSGMRREFLLLLLKSCDPSDMQYLGKVLPVLHRDFIARLPRNVSQRILMYVRPCDLAISAQVSRMWHSIVSEEALWTRLYGLIGLQSMADVFFQPQKSVKANAKRLSSMGHWAHGHFTYRAFRAHSLGVLTMAFDSKHVVTGSIDRTCRVFLLKTGQCIRTLVGHEGGVYAAQFDSDKVGGHASLL